MIPPGEAATLKAGTFRFKGLRVVIALLGALALRRLRPDIPIILMSGYGGPQLATRAAAIGINEVLRKPLQRRDLAESLARVLEFGADP
jgi:CheY-like chemotaxis protein